jgi:integrase
MGQKVPPGLIKRGEIWYIRKAISGRKVQESTGTSDLKEAERFLAHRIEQARNAEIYGIRPKRTFREAATRYLNETTKVSLCEDARELKHLDPYIGDLSLDAIHMGTLQQFIRDRKHRGKRKEDSQPKDVSKRTINAALQTVRRILNLAASEWIDDNGKTWLEHPPKIKLLSETDRRPPYPLSFDEQERLFAELPEHLAKMALFKVNTGCREAEVCSLRWEWEEEIPYLNTSVFIIPAHKVKNREERLVVLNSAARAVLEEVRGIHAEYVFTYRGRRINKMNDSGWKSARKRAGLPQVRVHDLKHTFGRRLRAAGVSFEDRQDLLGHRSGKITTHYSAPELINLIEASERVCTRDGSKLGTMVILKGNSRRLTAVK